MKLFYRKKSICGTISGFMDQYIFYTTEGLYELAQFFGIIVGFIGVLIILFGCMRALYQFVHRILFDQILLADIRVELGHYLALGIEFLVANDIIDTVIQPTWDELGKLAVLIVLRAALTAFLAHEVKEVREEMENEGAIKSLKKRFFRKA